MANYELPEGYNLYSADAMIEGYLVENPTFQKSGGMEFAILKIVTQKNFINTQTKQKIVRQTPHTIHMMKEAVLEAVRTFYRKGLFVKVRGELSLDVSGNIIVLVDNNGAIGAMDPALLSKNSLSSPVAASETVAKTGGLAAVAAKAPVDQVPGPSEQTEKKKDEEEDDDPMKGFDDLDDEIPF